MGISDFQSDACLYGQFKCANEYWYVNTGKGYERRKQCNAIDDCGDNSDEENCGKNYMRKSQFRALL